MAAAHEQLSDEIFSQWIFGGIAIEFAEWYEEKPGDFMISIFPYYQNIL